jgi:hypothetical protein
VRRGTHCQLVLMERSKFTACVLIIVSIGIYASGTADRDPIINSYVKVLEKFVDRQGFVDYKGLKAEPADLEGFVKALEEFELLSYESFSVREKIAFWLNAYNALTLKVIIDHYPIRSSLFKSLRYPKNSIRQIPGVWSKITFSVMGRDLSLDQIEHEILRKDFEEPRIHMALVCAARGCPLLRQEPYIGEKLDVQLEDQTRKFLSDPQKFFIDNNEGIVYLSSIFKWFGKDFLGKYSPKKGYVGLSHSKRAVLHFISRHLPVNQQNVLMPAKYKIKYLKYDWALNERSGK